MRRWTSYFLALLFLAGLVVFDLSLILDRTRLEERIHRALKSNLKAKVEYNKIEVEGIRNLRLTVVVSDVALFNERDRDRNAPFLTCERLAVGLDWRSLLSGRPEIDNVELVRPVVHLTWDAEGRLDIPSVVASTETKSRALTIPPIVIREMQVIAHNAPLMKPGCEHQLSGIQIELTPRRSQVFRYGVTGIVDDPIFGRFTIDGAFGESELRGAISRKDFRIEPAMIQCFDENFRKVLDPVEMDGEFDLSIAVDALDFHDRVEFSAEAEARGVSLKYRKWPTRITNLNGILRIAGGRLETQGLAFGLADGHVKLTRAEVDLTRAEPVFEVEGEALQILLNQRSVAEFRAYDEPGPTIADVLESIEARGTVDLGFAFRKTEEMDRVGVRVQVTFREAGLRFVGFPDENGKREGFPYPLEHVLGTVVVSNDELVFRDIRSQVKLPDVSARGTVTYGRRGLSFDVDIVGNNLRLDDKVRSCLTPDNQVIWDSYQPDGPVDFTLKVHRENSATATTKLDLEVQLKGIGALPKLFPYALEDVEGTLILGKEGGTRVKNIVARHGSTSIGIDGVVDLTSTVSEPSYSLDVKARDVFIDDDLLAAVSLEFPEISRAVRRFNFQGAVDFECTISSDVENSNNYLATLKDLSFEYDQLPGVTFRDLRGRLKTEGRKLQIEGATMTWRGNPLTVGGWMDIGETPRHDIQVKAAEILLDDALIEAAQNVVPGLSSLTDQVSLDGPLGIRFHLLANERGSGVKTDINALGLVITGKTTPFKIQDVYGSAEIQESGILLKSWTGTIPYHGEGEPNEDERIVITVPQGAWAKVKDVDILDLSDVRCDNIAFTPRIVAMFPEPMRTTLGGLNLKGTVDAQVGKFLLRNGEPTFGGRLDLKLVGFDAGFPIQVPRARIDFEGANDRNGELLIDGTITKGTMALGPFDLDDVAANLQFRSGELQFDRISAGFLDGALNPEGTSFRVGFAEGNPFQVSASLSEGRLSKLVEEFGGNPSRLDGKMSAAVQVSGRFADQGTWNGQGSARANGRRLYDLPFLADILRIVNFDFVTYPDNVQKGTMECRIVNHEVKLDRADFEGPGINLKGGGSIGFDGLCDMSFNLELIKWLDSIPILGDIVSLGRGMLWKSVRVQGPIEDPTATVENYISELLPSDPDSGRRVKTKPLKTKTDVRKPDSPREQEPEKP